MKPKYVKAITSVVALCTAIATTAYAQKMSTSMPQNISNTPQTILDLKTDQRTRLHQMRDESRRVIEQHSQIVAQNKKEFDSSQQLLNSSIRAARSNRKLLVQQIIADYKFSTNVQSAVADFVNEQEEAAIPLRAESLFIAQLAMRSNITSQQLVKSLESFRALVNVERKRRSQAFVALDTKVEFSKNPRLEAVLTSLGIIGDESSFAEGVQLDRLVNTAKIAKGL